jgi:hypothetical protein
VAERRGPPRLSLLLETPGQQQQASLRPAPQLRQLRGVFRKPEIIVGT